MIASIEAEDRTTRWLGCRVEQGRLIDPTDVPVYGKSLTFLLAAAWTPAATSAMWRPAV